MAINRQLCQVSRPSSFINTHSPASFLVYRFVSLFLFPFSLLGFRFLSSFASSLLGTAMAQEGAENGAMAAAACIAGFKAQLVVPAMKADEAVNFYKVAFGAEELKRTSHPKRKAEQELPSILCAELKIGSSSLLVCDQTEDSSASAGEGLVVFRVETEDVEGTVAKAVKAGAELLGEITEEESGCGCGLLGKVKDPFGVVWYIASAGKKYAEGEAEAEA